MTNKVLAIKWVQEVLILFASFILITLNGWRSILDWETGLQAFLYFTILYVHVILHRFALLPLFFKKQYIRYILLSLGLVLLFSALLYITGVYWIYSWIKQLKINKLEVYLYHVGTCILSLIAILGTFILLQFYNDQKKQELLQLSIDEMELKVLQSQLNPQFLYNTFNNLHNISLSEPERVPEFILEVSKLMRYHTESYKHNWASLEDELSFIEGYIMLEEERVGSNCEVHYDYISHNTSEQYLLPPLLLISFIDKAFRYSCSPEEKGFVHITLEVADDRLTLMVTNSITKLKPGGTKFAGLGTNSIKKRLETLYGEGFTLDIQPSASQYKIQLELPLHKNLPGTAAA